MYLQKLELIYLQGHFGTNMGHFTYGAECWPITENNHEKMVAGEMGFLQQASRVSLLKHIHKEVIREHMGMK